MRILHCCLAAFYIDNFGYQENILPKFHKNLGHEVEILASTENYIQKSTLGYVLPGTYINEDQIPVTRIPYIKWLPFNIVKKLRIYEGIGKILNSFKPDVIFLHDSQFLSILEFKKYAKKNDVKIIIDSHTDMVNSGRSWISMNLLHKQIYKYCIKKIEKYTTVFFATLPIRKIFLEKIYNVESSKIKLLPFGIDDSLFLKSEISSIRYEMRKALNYNNDDIVIITGGKLDFRKNIHLLLESFNKLKVGGDIKKLKLLLFGKPTEDLKRIILPLIESVDVKYIDWIAAKDLHKYFFLADLGFFPGTHSVLWEEAVGAGLPCVFKRWDGITHIDLNGNCILMDTVNVDTLKEVLQDVDLNREKLNNMKLIANRFGPEIFSYSKIAYKSLSI